MTAWDEGLLGVAALCALLVLYPFAFYPLILSLLPVRPLRRSTTADRLRMSLLFCAYNEAASMPLKLENLRSLKLRYPDLEILAYDDGSSDDTVALIKGAGDLVSLIEGPGRTGKAHGMKRLAALATGDVLVFTDANVVLDAAAIDRLSDYYRDPDVGGVLGTLTYLRTEEAGSATAATGGFYWRLEERLKDLESATGNVMGADGSIFSIRRRYYPEFPDTVLDDLTVSMNVVFSGARLVKAKDVLAFEQLVSARSEEYRRKVRIAARAWHTHSYLRENLRRMSFLDRFKYASRKIVRWFGAIWIVLGAVSAFTLAWRLDPQLALGLTVAACLTLGIGAFMRRGPFAALVDILLAYVSTFRGIVMGMRGATMATWAPAKSRDGQTQG